MKPNMHDNFNLLIERVLDTLDKTDLTSIQTILRRIKEPTICTGVGGSRVVSTYVAKTLSIKNNCHTEVISPYDVNHRNTDFFYNIISCSYSGANVGVEAAFNNPLTHYLLSTRMIEGINNLTYESSLPNERSFISLAATLMPMSIILAYYLDNDLSIIKDILSKHIDYSLKASLAYEIFSGYETCTASNFLESTFTEAGLSIPIVHDKYDYCHGRSTITKISKNSVIYFDQPTELDEYLKSVLPIEYEDITIVKPYSKDPVINDFYLTYQAMYLARSLAEAENKDLSLVDYSPLVKKLYHYKGEM